MRQILVLHYSLDTVRYLNVYKLFRTPPGRSIYILCPGKNAKCSKSAIKI